MIDIIPQEWPLRLLRSALLAASHSWTLVLSLHLVMICVPSGGKLNWYNITEMDPEGVELCTSNCILCSVLSSDTDTICMSSGENETIVIQGRVFLRALLCTLLTASHSQSVMLADLDTICGECWITSRLSQPLKHASWMHWGHLLFYPCIFTDPFSYPTLFSPLQLSDLLIKLLSKFFLPQTLSLFCVMTEVSSYIYFHISFFTYIHLSVYLVHRWILFRHCHYSVQWLSMYLAHSLTLILTGYWALHLTHPRYLTMSTVAKLNPVSNVLKLGGVNHRPYELYVWHHHMGTVYHTGRCLKLWLP